MKTLIPLSLVIFVLLAVPKVDSRRLNLELIQAAYYGHTETANSLLLKGADPIAKNRQGISACINAALNSHWNLVEAFVQLNLKCLAEVNTQGNSLLHIAASKGNNLWVEKLLDMGANLELKNIAGSTPLHLAIYEKRLDTTKLLISKGANILSTNNYRETPLHLAAWIGDYQIARLLLNKNAPCRALANAKETPLDYSKKKKHPEVAKLLTSCK